MSTVQEFLAVKEVGDEVKKRVARVLKPVTEDSLSLADYVFVMVEMGKSRAEMSEALSSFIPDAASFVEWLNTLIVALKTDGLTASCPSWQPSSSAPAAVSVPSAETAAASISGGDAPMDGSSRDRGRRAPRIHSAVAVSEGDRRRGRGGRRSSTGVAPEQQGEGRGRRRASDGAGMSTEDDGHKRQRAPVRFTVTLNGVDSAKKEPDAMETASMETAAMETAKMDTDAQPAAKARRKVKCSFFPNCAKPDCPFVHPTEPCKKFPHCPFGAECLYIHPDCRHGASCMRPDCPFQHPGRPPMSSAQQQQQQIAMMMMQMPMMGKFGGAPRAGVPSGAPPCKNGYACPGRKDRSCHFAHPPGACRNGDNCPRFRAGDCKFAHGKPCRNGPACTVPMCTFVHEPADAAPQQQQEMCAKGVDCSDVECKLAHPSRFGTQAQPQQQQQQQQQQLGFCPLGSNCTDFRCKFDHTGRFSTPPATLTPQEQAATAKLSETLPSTPPHQ